jgi:hypothetical protein
VAVTSVKETYERSSTQDNKWKRKYTRTWLVETDNPLDGSMRARTAIGIPAIGNSYWVDSTENDPGSFVQSVNATCLGAGPAYSQWKVVAEYAEYDASQFPQNPLEWPIQINWSGTQFEKVIYYDINDKAIVNSAGEPFGEPVTIDDSRPVLTIVRNEPTYDLAIVDEYRDTLNADTFMGASPGLVKVSFMPGELQYNKDAGGSGFYYKITYTFNFNRDGWKKKILDRGFSELDASDKLKTILGPDGQPLAEASLLDGTGHPLPFDGTPVYQEFDVYQSKNFSDFGFQFAGAPGQ